MYADVSFQNVKLSAASCFADLASTPFIIKFDSTNRGDEAGFGQVCFHLENADLARALVKAINDTLKAFEGRAAAVPEMESTI